MKAESSYDSGYLGSLMSGAPVNFKRTQPAKVVTIDPQPTSTSEYLRKMAGANTAQYLSAMSRNSTSFTGGNMMVVSNSTIASYTATQRDSFSYSPSSPAREFESKRAGPSSDSALHESSVNTGTDYLSALSSPSLPSRSFAPYAGPKKSYAPGGGKIGLVKESGYLSKLSSGMLTSQTNPVSYAPSSPSPVVEASTSILRASSSGDYLSALSGLSGTKSATASTDLKKSYAPGGKKISVVKESGFLASLSSPSTQQPSYSVASTLSPPASSRESNGQTSLSSNISQRAETKSSSLESLYSTLPPRPVEDVEFTTPGWKKDATSPIKSYLSTLRS
jgi:hypothetical protein